MYLCTLALASLAWLAPGSSSPTPPRDPLGQEADGVESGAPLKDSFRCTSVTCRAIPDR